MVPINLIFDQGPEAVIDTFAHCPCDLPPMDVKELADICWTRASTPAKAQTSEAAKWARAALLGYEILSQSGNCLTSESASESLQALRAWKLLEK